MFRVGVAAIPIAIRRGAGARLTALEAIALIATLVALLHTTLLAIALIGHRLVWLRPVAVLIALVAIPIVWASGRAAGLTAITLIRHFFHLSPVHPARR